MIFRPAEARSTRNKKKLMKSMVSGKWKEIKKTFPAADKIRPPETPVNIEMNFGASGDLRTAAEEIFFFNPRKSP